MQRFPCYILGWSKINGIKEEKTVLEKHSHSDHTHRPSSLIWAEQILQLQILVKYCAHSRTASKGVDLRLYFVHLVFWSTTWSLHLFFNFSISAPKRLPLLLRSYDGLPTNVVAALYRVHIWSGMQNGDRKTRGHQIFPPFNVNTLQVCRQTLGKLWYEVLLGEGVQIEVPQPSFCNFTTKKVHGTYDGTLQSVDIKYSTRYHKCTCDTA